MYHLLIVDDEILECRYLEGLTDWQALGIGHVHIANSMEQAIAVLEQEPVSIVLCDIEMPRQSGMDLLAWIRSRQYACEVIFITCHASFDFAQKAMRLGSLDYLLKPVEEETVLVAVHRALERLQENTRPGAARQAQVDRFLEDAIQGTLTAEETGQRLADLGLDWQLDEPLVPSLFLSDWLTPNNDLMAKSLKSYMINNIVSDVIFDFNENALVSVVGGERCLAIAPLRLYPGAPEGPDTTRFHGLIRSSREYAGLTTTCIIAPRCLPGEIAAELPKLLRFVENNVCIAGKLIDIEHARGVRNEDNLLNVSHWSALLKEGDVRSARAYFDRGIAALESADYIGNNMLTDLFSGMMQELYKLLQEKNIPIHNFLPQEHWKEIHTSSLSAVHRFATNVRMLMDRFDSSQKPTVEQKIKNYILCNLDRNITREEIAKHVYLTPEYVSKLFRKETGLRLSDYVVQAKIEAAKQMLSSPEVPISTIASRLGYNNFSHFTKQFREQVGVTPSAYRREHDHS